VGEAVKRGVAERKARQLALDVADDQPVLDQIEYVDYLIQQDRRGRGTIANPAGFLVWAIENNLSVPPEFETSRKARLRQALEQASQNQRFAALSLENEYEQFCQEQVQKQFVVAYPAERLETALREQMKAIRREQPEWFARVPDTTRREVAMGRLKSGIRETLDLPSREAWSKLNLQQRLY
jgi:hypothetical protein